MEAFVFAAIGPDAVPFHVNGGPVRNVKKVGEVATAPCRRKMRKSNIKGLFH